MRVLLATLALTLLAAAPARAATLGFASEFWDADRSFRSIEAAASFAAENAPSATFTAIVIDFPAGRQRTVQNRRETLESYLGPNATGLSGAPGLTLRQSVFRFSGVIQTLSGANTFRVGSDDGFQLTIGGAVVSRHTRPRAFRETSVTVDLDGGPIDFELIYYENFGNTGVEFRANDVIVDRTLIPTPLPAGAPLLIGAFAALGLLRLRTRRTA